MAARAQPIVVRHPGGPTSRAVGRTTRAWSVSMTSAAGYSAYSGGAPVNVKCNVRLSPSMTADAPRCGSPSNGFVGAGSGGAQQPEPTLGSRAHNAPSISGPPMRQAGNSRSPRSVANSAWPGLACVMSSGLFQRRFWGAARGPCSLPRRRSRSPSGSGTAGSMSPCRKASLASPDRNPRSNLVCGAVRTSGLGRWSTGKEAHRCSAQRAYPQSQARRGSPRAPLPVFIDMSLHPDGGAHHQLGRSVVSYSPGQARCMCWPRTSDDPWLIVSAC